MPGIVGLAFAVLWMTLGMWHVRRIEAAGHSWAWRFGGWVVFGVGSLTLISLTV